MATSPPTSMRGYVDDAVAYGGLLADFADTVPECSWPLSTETFRQMRRHPQLAAIEKAWTLPIRRATWSVNAEGCRPEVAQLVAADLGLPVAGKDEPSAARTRGVSWPDHLRLALLALPFGFSAFEMLAEMRDGKARLVELSERLPSTVSEFHVDKVGRLTGISQLVLPGSKAPQIRTDRLVLYSREREGAAYWGNSILRPAYSGFLLSREMLRVLAISNRRFGMGVPVIRPLAGTTETPEQASAAARLAQDVRVGEAGGAALPPGYIMELIGQSGGSPDTLGFLRYLDHAMASSCLAGFIDLGTTASGSRALAGEFIDLFLLAIQSEALSIADTITRQAAARIVEWNWGGSEPVPSVQVSDVGTKHDITAEALNLLLNSGALSSDPALEAHVRRMFKLPEREEQDGRPTPSGRIFEHDVTSGVITRNERRAQIGLPPVEGGDILADPAKPTAPVVPEPKVTAKRRRQADGQLALPIAAAADDDEAAGVQRDYEAALAALLAAWPALAAPLVADLVVQAVTAGTVGLASLAASSGTVDALTVAITDAMTSLAQHSANQVAASAQAQGVDVPPTGPDEGRLAEVASVTAALIASAYASAAARRALQAPADAVATVVGQALTDMSQAARGMVADHLGAALSTAQGQGRLAVLASAPAVSYRADESQDQAACDECRAVAGTRYPTLDDALRDYPNGLTMARCAGGARCRGHLVPVWS